MGPLTLGAADVADPIALAASPVQSVFTGSHDREIFDRSVVLPLIMAQPVRRGSTYETPLTFDLDVPWHRRSGGVHALKSRSPVPAVVSGEAS